jgi:hypothetical protein
MGLFAIAIRDAKVASEIPAILERHGYAVRLTNENDCAIFYDCPIKRGKLWFSISKGSPQRFSIGVGREGRAIVHILDKEGVFQADVGGPVWPRTGERNE